MQVLSFLVGPKEFDLSDEKIGDLFLCQNSSAIISTHLLIPSTPLSNVR